MESNRWWRHGVVYQTYLRSFADGDGDGTGDLAGLRARLPHLVDLGVDALWVNPWYPSPLRDGGYDVADYFDIDPRFGTLADADALIAEAHEHGLRVVIDLVPNHTSIDHAWFQAALAAGVGSRERERYHFRDGTSDGGPPNNWPSVFGGPAWTQLPDGQWYLHLFDSSQPDLNWAHRDVLDHFESYFRFWLDRGVDGFRVDVAHALSKDPSLPDLTETRTQLLAGTTTAGHPFWDRDEVHDIIRTWRAILDEYGDHTMMVAEAWVAPDRLPAYLAPDEYHQSFNFDLLSASWDADAFRIVISQALADAAAVGATSTWVLSNHDVMRHATRYGLPQDIDWRLWPVFGPHEALDVDLGSRRARAAALVLLALPGAAYVYQGDELGLPEVWDLPESVLDDPVWERTDHAVKGRDGCRVPMPWAPDGPSYGFGAGPAWLPQPPVYGDLAASVQAADPASMLALYRDALALRRAHLVADEVATVEAADPARPGVLAFVRGSGVRCVANMGVDPVPLPEGEILVSSSPVTGHELPPDTTIWCIPGDRDDSL